MKHLIITILTIFLGTSSICAEPIVVSEEKLSNGEVIKMCTFENGQYGYCTEEDKNKAIRHYQASEKSKSKIENFNDGLNNTVNSINNILNSVRVISGFLGI